ncbi:hypothetical protein Tfer_0925 [Thermincola ferriacetica]|uniref:Stage 0 sporulation protein A homolog n=1 Tax=Thermincola ferriacetica TaxID=281456 RepID=A0A0L6W5J5_9FIRM|nr:hypothetical protein [Thermincola ferriacetica]KNZ70364.1 hypothetical protein Tfer_0925 [Thermincola ferriacetica]
MRLLLATGYADVDKKIREYIGDKVIGDIQYREGVVDEACRINADTVLLSWYLPGKGSMPEILFRLLKADIRPVLMMGEMKYDSPEVLQAFLLGVRDFTFNPVRVSELIRQLEHPSKYGELIEKMNPVDAPGEAKKLTRLFRKLVKAEEKQTIRLPPVTADNRQNGTRNDSGESAALNDIKQIKQQLQGIMALLNIPPQTPLPEAALMIEQKIINLL